MIGEADLRALLAAPAESVTLDFKEQINWGDRGASLGIARDIACLANRNGGLLVFGVFDLAGRLEPRGLVGGDSLPDPSIIGRLLGNHFDPAPIFEAAEIELDGRRYGVVQVQEFRRVPHVCRVIGQDSSGHTVFAPGDLLRRTDAMECSKVTTADAMSAIIESSVAKTGAIVRGMLDPTPERSEFVGPQTGSTARPVDFTTPLLEVEGAIRACDLEPLGAPVLRPVRELPALVSAATVHNRFARSLVPRLIDMERMAPSAFIREPSRIVAEATRQSGEGADRTSVVEVTTELRVRLRERLWEDAGQVDITSLLSFVMGCLLFSQRLYAATEVPRFRMSIGLLAATGHRLVADASRFTPLFHDYVATSTTDLLATRELDLSALESPDGRDAAARDLITELAWYFGFVVGDPAFEAQIRYVRENVPDL